MCNRLLLLALLALLAGCRNRDDAMQRDTQALLVARALDARSLDPSEVTDSESLETIELIFEGLVRWRPGTTEIEPALALSWHTSDGGRRWTFALRPGVTFQDGTPCNADAVMFSFERLRQAKGRAGTEFRDIASIAKVNDLTVEFVLKQAYAPFLANLAIPAAGIVSPAAVALWGPAFGEHPVGTGPYRLASWRRGERIVLRRYANYWGPPAASNRIVFQVIADPAQRIVELETGAADIALGMLPHERSFVQLHPNLQLYEAATNNISYLAMNTARPALADVRVRQAIIAAINSLPIIKVGYQGHAEPARGMLPPMQWPALPNLPNPYNPNRARELLAAATAAGTFDPDRTLRLFAPNQPRAYLLDPDQVAHLIQASLAEVGIEVEIVAQAFEQHVASVERGEHDLCLLGWVGDNGDPDNFLFGQFGSQNADLPHPRNFAFLRDPKLDATLIAAQKAESHAVRTELYQQAQRRILELAPWVPLAHSRYVVALRADLEHIMLTPTGHLVYAAVQRKVAR